MRKYCIGFFSAVLVVVCVITLGYQMTYQYTNTKAEQNRLEAKTESLQNSDSISTKGNAMKNSGYYISVLQGYVVVYYSDHKTIFEVTDIPVSSLPENVQDKVMNSIYMESEEQLYRFLENYSS